MGYYCCPHPRGVLLDTSALRHLSGAALREISGQHQIHVPSYIVRELFTTDDRSKVPGQLRKLLPLNGVVVDQVKAHVIYEMSVGRSSGILLAHSGAPGFPEQAYPLLIQAAIDRFNSNAPTETELLVREHDLKAEGEWLGRCQNLLGKMNRLPEMKDLRQGLNTKYFDDPNELQRIVSEWMREDFPRCREDLGFAKGDFPTEAFDATWAFNRYLFALAWYHVLNAKDNPESFNHDRLNQRLDLMFITLLHPGLKLLSYDGGMKNLAQCLHGPDALLPVG